MNPQVTYSSDKSPYLYIYREQFSIVTDNIQQKIMVDASGDFDVSCADSWLKVGKSGNTINVSADKLSGSTSRESTIVVKLKGQPHERRIKVVQFNSEWLAVDLGLSVKWASMNVGAIAPENVGDYFAWGETEPRDFNYGLYWDEYKWWGNYDDKTSSVIFTKYNFTDGKTVLDLSDDAVHVNWGGDWRMPSVEEVKELMDNCDVSVVNESNAEGCLLTSKLNGKSIFIPYYSRYNDSSYQFCVYWINSLYDWSSSEGEVYEPKAYASCFLLGEKDYPVNISYRYEVLPIRPVCP